MRLREDREGRGVDVDEAGGPVLPEVAVRDRPADDLPGLVGVRGEVEADRRLGLQAPLEGDDEEDGDPECDLAPEPPAADLRQYPFFSAFFPVTMAIPEDVPIRLAPAAIIRLAVS